MSFKLPISRLVPITDNNLITSTPIMSYKKRFIRNGFETSWILGKIKKQLVYFYVQTRNGKMETFSDITTFYFKVKYFFAFWPNFFFKCHFLKSFFLNKKRLCEFWIRKQETTIKIQKKVTSHQFTLFLINQNRCIMLTPKFGVAFILNVHRM